MGTTKKDENKVDLTTPTNPLQEQGKNINVADTPTTEDKPKVHINVGNDADENPYANKPIAKQQATYEMPDYTDYENSKVRATEIRQDLEREGEERRQNNRRIMTAIGDGLSGLANIYFTSQGTPDLLKGAPSLTGKMQERYDKMRKDAETRRANYLKVVQEGADQKVKDMYTRYKDDLEAKRKEEELELKRNKDARDEIKANYEAKKAKLNADLLTHKIDEAKYNADIAEAERNYANELLQAKINRYNRTGTGRSSGGGSGRGPGGSSKSKQDSQTVTENEYKDGKKVRSVRTTTYGNQSKNQKQKPTGNRASQISYRKNK